MESDKETACITIPNLEFVIKHVNELGRLHKIIKDYINTDIEHTGSVAKALRFSLQEKMNLYYVYVNNWVSNIFVVNIQLETSFINVYFVVTCQP